MNNNQHLRAPWPSLSQVRGQGGNYQGWELNFLISACLLTCLKVSFKELSNPSLAIPETRVAERERWTGEGAMIGSLATLSTVLCIQGP